MDLEGCSLVEGVNGPVSGQRPGCGTADRKRLLGCVAVTCAVVFHLTLCCPENCFFLLLTLSHGLCLLTLRYVNVCVPVPAIALRVSIWVGGGPTASTFGRLPRCSGTTIREVKLTFAISHCEEEGRGGGAEAAQDGG